MKKITKAERWRRSEKGRAYNKQYKKTYYQRNKTRIDKRNRAWRLKNPARHKFLVARYADTHKEENRLRAKEHSRALRKEALQSLGNKCIGCGNTDKRVLQIDHTRGTGNHDIFGRRGHAYLQRVINHVKRHGKRVSIAMC